MTERATARRRGGLPLGVALLITAALLTWVGLTTDLAEAARAFGHADFLMMATAAALFPLVLITFDAGSLRWLLRRAGYPIPMADMVRVRGAAQLGSIVSYGLALGMMTAALADRGRRPWISVAGVFVLVGLADVAATSTLVLLALAAQASELPDLVTTVLLASCLSGLVVLPVAWAMVRRRGMPRRLATLLEDREVLVAVRRLGWRDVAAMALARLGLRLLGAVEFYVYALALQFTASFSAVVVFDAVTAVVASMPFTVAELGSTHVMMRWLWVPYAPAGFEAVPAVDAFSTASVVIYTLQKVVIGLACLPWFLRAFGRSRWSD